MQERRPPTRLEVLSTRGTQFLGFFGLLTVAATALNLEEVAARNEIPVSMGAYFMQPLRQGYIQPSL